MSAVRDDKGRRTEVTSVALCALFADSPFSIRNSRVIVDQSDPDLTPNVLEFKVFEVGKQLSDLNRVLHKEL